MGMDVYGKAATSDEGLYFRASIWTWRPLADYCREVAPLLCAPCRYWHSNDGDGLDAAGASALADALDAELASGRTELYERRYKGRIELLPNKPCRICAGTGTRPPAPHIGAGDPKNGGLKCNGCDGEGHVRPDEAHYPFDTDTVRRFAAFLRASGGFEIR